MAKQAARRLRRICAALAVLLPAAGLIAEQPLVDHHVRVRLSGPPDAAARAALADAGVALLTPSRPDVFYARLSRGADEPQLAALGAVVEPVPAAEKVHHLLKAGVIPSWAALEKDERGRAHVAAIVLLHRDEPLGAAAAALLNKYEGVVLTELATVNGVIAALPASSVEALAAEDAVMWIEPPLPRFEPWNDSSRALIEADALQAAPYGLDGSGVEVFVFDSATVMATHPDLAGRVSILDEEEAGGHATHVAGTIGGSGANSNGLYRGMAPAVQFLSAGLEGDGSGILLYTNPGDIEMDYAAAVIAKAPGRLICSNSIGANIWINGYDCSLLGDYGTTAATVDALVRGAAGEPLIVVWAGSNERGLNRCSWLHGTISPPATAKNPITVGAVNSNDDSMTSFSSWGPTDDGRLTPTVVAPGCQRGGDSGVTSTDLALDATPIYAARCGTSMAAPAAAGVAAVLLQDWRAHYPSLAEPTNAMMKMILAHTAADLPPVGPDYMTGYGSVRAVAAAEFVRSGDFTSGAVSLGGAWMTSLSMPAGASSLKLTLVWDDAPGTPGAPAALVNDIDLRVTDPLGARHYPWTLNPADPAAAADRMQEDHVNVVEQVVVDEPAPGTWIIEVAGTSVPEAPQDFALGFSIAGPLLTCVCDPNGDGADVFDLLAYLDHWFAGATAAEMDGVPGIDVFDLLTFLDCWFDGCQ